MSEVSHSRKLQKAFTAVEYPSFLTKECIFLTYTLFLYSSTIQKRMQIYVKGSKRCGVPRTKYLFLIKINEPCPCLSVWLDERANLSYIIVDFCILCQSIYQSIYIKLQFYYYLVFYIILALQVCYTFQNYVNSLTSLELLIEHCNYMI